MSSIKEESAWDLPETTEEEIINKITALAWEIRNNWTNPRGDCRKIVALCESLKELKKLV